MRLSALGWSSNGRATPYSWAAPTLGLSHPTAGPPGPRRQKLNPGPVSNPGPLTGPTSPPAFPHWKPPSALLPKGPQAFESYHRALFRAIFVESIDVSDYSQLTALAAREGLDAERFKRDLEGGQQKVAVIGEHLEMVMEYGEAPSGLPLVVIEGREPIVGAAPADLYRRILERAIEKRGVG